MLQTMRSHAGSWVIKFLLGAIVASFALVGISDLVRNHGRHKAVATVNGHDISGEEFDHLYKNTLRTIQANAKGALTPEQIASLNISDVLLNGLMGKILMHEDMKKLGIVVSDDRIKREIQSIPNLMTQDGTFNHALFQQALKAQGTSEGQFIDDMRNQLKHYQLFGSLNTGLRLSAPYARLLFDALEQSFHFVAVDFMYEAMPDPKILDEQTVERFFNGNQEMFREPELRTLKMLRFDGDLLKQDITLLDDEIQARYTLKKNQAAAPAKRKIIALTLPSSEHARKAFDALQMGKPIKAVAREGNGAWESLGEMNKQEFAHVTSPDIAEMVFDLHKGDTSKPQDTPKGWVMYHVETIAEAPILDDDALKAQAKEELYHEKINGQIETLQNKVEDDLASGESMESVAKKYNLSVAQVDNITAQGMNDKGEDVLDPAVKKEVLEYAFSEKESTDSPLILATYENGVTPGSLKGVVVRIESIKQSHIPAFQTIQAKVKEALYADLRRQEAFKEGKIFIKGTHSLKDFNRKARGSNLKAIHLPKVSRSTAHTLEEFTQTLSQKDLEAIFALRKDETLLVEMQKGVRVIMWHKMDAAPFDEKKFQVFQGALDQGLTDDMSMLYQKGLKEKANITVHEDVIKSVVGAQKSEEEKA